MPFREKSAWISLAVLFLTFGPFFILMRRGDLPPGSLAAIHAFFACFIGFLILQLVLHVTAAVLTPKEAKAPADEREKLIGLKADRNAYIALICGVLLVPLSMHPGGPGVPELGYVAILALVVSEGTRFTSQILYYRRGL